MRAITEQQKQEAIAAFAYEGTLIADTVYGSGHINDTFRLTFAVGNMGDLDVILQRMNADAFPHPGNISRWEYLFVDVEVVLDGIFPDNALRKERALQRLYEKPWFLEEAEYPKEAAKIKEILNIMRKGDEFYLEEAKALLGCLLLEITRLNYTNKETRADAEQGRITCIVSRAMDYISDHYMEPIRVEQLAKYSHLSETHFRRVFTEYMHMGPLEYINTVRIRTACEHLKKTEEPVADIAHKCGFTTNSTFNRNFKQMMGVTPVEWRKRPENYEQRLLNYEIHTEKGW